jgi:pimeloyl-ACP methyl ester carboxylesterase
MIARRLCWTLSLAVLMGCSNLGLAERPDSRLADNSVPEAAPAAPTAKPTLGGTQFWSDRHFFHDWRIQEHCTSGACRLLDGDSWEHASGSFDYCLQRLHEIAREENLPPMSGKAVVILHGLAAPRWSMHLLGTHLHDECGYSVFNVEYASTRRTIDDHALTLKQVINSLQGIDRIDLIGHSMGNIVIRRYLAGQRAGPNGQPGWQPDDRIGRIVMIAPPNHGSLTARRLSDFRLFEFIFGNAGQQLGDDWPTLERRLATPQVEFGIIAGGMNNSTGFSFRLPGDDDGRITVETTRLDGAADFITVPMLHELIANDVRAIRYTRQFLESGYFVSPEDRQPIPVDTVGTRTASAPSQHLSDSHER